MCRKLILFHYCYAARTVELNVYANYISHGKILSEYIEFPKHQMLHFRPTV